MIHALYIGNKPTNITVQPDPIWLGMWRIHQGDQISDMVNLARAKDAATTWARPPGGKQRLGMRWKGTKTP